MDTITFVCLFFLGAFIGFVFIITIIINAIIKSNAVGDDVGNFRNYDSVYGTKYLRKINDAPTFNITRLTNTSANSATICRYCGSFMQAKNKPCPKCGKRKI